MNSSIKNITTLIVCLLFSSFINGQIKSLKTEKLSFISELQEDSTKIIPILDYVINTFDLIGITDSSDVRMFVKQANKDQFKIEFYYRGFKDNPAARSIEYIITANRVFYYKNKRFSVITADDSTELFFSKYFKDIGCINKEEVIPNYDIQAPFVEINAILSNNDFHIKDVEIEFPYQKK